jgi:hypothetical protein
MFFHSEIKVFLETCVIFLQSSIFYLNNVDVRCCDYSGNNGQYPGDNSGKENNKIKRNLNLVSSSVLQKNKIHVLRALQIRFLQEMLLFVKISYFNSCVKDVYVWNSTLGTHGHLYNLKQCLNEQK